MKEVPGSMRKAKRYDVWSRITLKPTAEDDYADYTCEARHEALPADMPMRTTVQLSVLCKLFHLNGGELIIYRICNEFTVLVWSGAGQ